MNFNLVEIMTEATARTRANIMTGLFDISVMRVVAGSFPVESGGGIKFSSKPFMMQASHAILRSVMAGTIERAKREASAPTGMFSTVKPTLMEAWTKASIDD